MYMKKILGKRLMLFALAEFAKCFSFQACQKMLLDSSATFLILLKMFKTRIITKYNRKVEMMNSLRSGSDEDVQ